MTDTDALRRQWLAEEAAAFQGWDFSHLTGRMTEEPLPWDYRAVIGQSLRPEHQMLDMATGGGEFLLSLGHPHENTCVTEAYPPNIALCGERLTPLGITVRPAADGGVIPYGGAEFDIVLNRHGAFNAREVFRVLKPGGVFITQQVGGQDDADLSKLLIPDFTPPFAHHTLAFSQALLQDAGFTVTQSGECFSDKRFADVGAAVYYAKIIEWGFPGFSVERCFDALLELQKTFERQGHVKSRQHRFVLAAKKTG